MIYVMSDLHGCYEEYIKMLELIKFNEKDTLYIIGDVCDRGPNPMKILFHMKEHENIIPLFGNHDIDSYNGLLYTIKGTINPNDRRYLWWLSGGGKSTLADFISLTVKEQDEIIDYLEEFRYYEELEVNGVNYLLVHGGLKDFEVDKPLSSYYVYDMLWERPNYDEVYFEDKVIISGHTPTFYIDKNMKGKIIKKNNHIAIDCGCVYGYGLGCLCLDTMEEFYIRKETK